MSVTKIFLTYFFDNRDLLPIPSGGDEVSVPVLEI